MRFDTRVVRVLVMFLEWMDGSDKLRYTVGASSSSYSGGGGDACLLPQDPVLRVGSVLTNGHVVMGEWLQMTGLDGNRFELRARDTENLRPLLGRTERKRTLARGEERAILVIWLNLVHKQRGIRARGGKWSALKLIMRFLSEHGTKQSERIQPREGSGCIDTWKWM